MVDCLRKFCVRESIPGLGSSASEAKCIHSNITAKKPRFCHQEEIGWRCKQGTCRAELLSCSRIASATFCLHQTKMTFFFSSAISVVVSAKNHPLGARCGCNAMHQVPLQSLPAVEQIEWEKTTLVKRVSPTVPKWTDIAQVQRFESCSPRTEKFWCVNTAHLHTKNRPNCPLVRNSFWELLCNRHCNAMFADNIRTGIATCGGCLTAAEQTAGVKQGETLHRKICAECNNTEKHNQHAHPHLMKVCKEDPSVFKVPLTWQQLKLELERLLKQHECCFNNWKKSGNHGAFDHNKDNNEAKPLPFADFVGTNALPKCLHEFVCQFPNVFKKVIGNPPKGAFWESIGDNR